LLVWWGVLVVVGGVLGGVLWWAAIVGPGRSAELFDGAYAEHARRLARVLKSTEEEEHGSPQE
jgi:hypothetical protein